MSKGFVYILTNPSMPGIVKIGKTTRCASSRAAELYQTGVPTPFEVYYEMATPDCGKLEADIHYHLTEFRVSREREFFYCDAAEAMRLVAASGLDQLQALVSEYAEGMILIHESLCVSDNAISSLSSETGASIFSVTDALGMVTPDELKPALQRAHDASQRRQFEREVGLRNG